jgi:SAM-dependent methyltransferase
MKKIKLSKNENRSFSQIEEHYKLEKKLAKKLRNTTKSNRKHRYTKLYNELYTKLPHHPRWNAKRNSKNITDDISKQMHLIKCYLNPEFTFLEIGPGNCLLALEVAKYLKKVYVADVSNVVTRDFKFPKNFEFIVSDGSSIPLPKNTINVVYSNQLMEHLHPDDALEQVKSIFAVLVPGGKYICITPNRLNGPHDISKYFDQVATGFHLKEYTLTELVPLFKSAGFSKINLIITIKNHVLSRKFPLFIVIFSEYLLSKLPYSLRKRLANWAPCRLLLDIKIVVIK